MPKVVEITELHHRVLKKTSIEMDSFEWDISTVRLVREEPENPGEMIAIMVDKADDVKWLYETMIFKKVDGIRVGPMMGAAVSFGYYRSDSSENIVKAHTQIVSLIAEGKLTPITSKVYDHQISSHIVKAMITEDQEEV